MSTSLLNLAGEYQMLLEIAKDPETDEQTLIDTMEALTGEISAKAGGYVAVINTLQGRADTLKKESENLSNAAKVLENNIKRMKDRIKYTMEQMDVKTIESEFHTIKIVKNGGVEPLKITGDVPDNYKKVILENDNEKIRKDLKAGVKLEFAHLEERGTHLRIS